MDKEKILKIVAIVFSVLILGDVIFLNIKLFSSGQQAETSSMKLAVPIAVPTSATSDNNYSCPLACREIVKSEIGSAIAALPTIAPAAAQTKTPTFVSQVAYLPLGGGSSTIERSWKEIDGSDFIFDLADYPATARVYWQGNLKMQNAGSRCFARLYDEDNKRGVDYSEQTTDKTTYETLTSQPLAIWRGKNHYHMEIKSLDGSICYLDSPRLIIRY